MLWSLAWLAPLSLLMSDLSRTWAWPLAIVVAALGVFEAVRHRARRPCTLVIPIGHGQPTCDGLPMLALKIEWRGPLAFLHWRDPHGRTKRLAFWPDTLPSASRRELRLAAMRIEPARLATSMAG
ncbi:MAG: hypothetical protein ACOH1L_02160 [Thermomonas sp.]